jgi:hypothetical protein
MWPGAWVAKLVPLPALAVQARLGRLPEPASRPGGGQGGNFTAQRAKGLKNLASGGRLGG